MAFVEILKCNLLQKSHRMITFQLILKSQVVTEGGQLGFSTLLDNSFTGPDPCFVTCNFELSLTQFY